MNRSKPGFWQSSLTEQQAVSASRDYGQLSCSDSGVLYWVEYRPDEAGRNLLCRYSDERVTELTAADFSVQSRVHEYGGRSWCLLGERLVFVNAQDQQLYLQSALLQESPQPLTHCPDSRFIEPVWDQPRNRLIVVEELHCPTGVINRLSAVDLITGDVSVLHQLYDFYAYPCLSHAGDQLAFVAWNHPQQPWTATQLYLAELTVTGSLNDPLLIAGGDDQEAITQPQFTVNDALCYVSDQQGYWSGYQYVAGDNAKALHVVDADSVSAPWQSGLLNYHAEEQFWISYKHAGAELSWAGRVLTLPEYSYFRAPVMLDGRVYCVAAGPDRLTGIIAITPEGNVTVICGGEQPLTAGECSQPHPMTFRQDDPAYGYFYPARNRAHSNAGPTPLVVFLHGGPTAATYPILNLKLQYWTQRGFAVLDLNYRGSSNCGRAYRMALKGQWGVAEVDDIGDSVTELVAAGLVDPAALFVRGNSSGGYSALNALAELDLFSGGASLYGVTDALALRAVTHKFESRYLDWLIGDPVEDADKFYALSPISKAAKIETPVIFFQGEKDRVVVPEQTHAMAAQIKARGVRCEVQRFADEAHGFRKAENQIQVLAQELAFYQSLLPCSPD